MLVPGGFGQRGVEGMVLAAKYCRQNGVPYLGICLGLQVSPCSKWHPSLAYVSKLEGLPGIWTMAMHGLVLAVGGVSCAPAQASGGAMQACHISAPAAVCCMGGWCSL